MKIKIYTAAGGNATAICSGLGIRNENYEKLYRLIMSENKLVEQVGFRKTDRCGLPKLQMAGGEFCGNASRTFACLLRDEAGKDGEYEFTVSGFPEVVKSQVRKIDNNVYNCQTVFMKMVESAKIEKKEKGINVVYLGGIVHIVLNEVNFPFYDHDYAARMKAIKDVLEVDGDAVGVIWMSKKAGRIGIKPVVWVKAIDTCFFESSCGSGSIAAGIIAGIDAEIFQPTGKAIMVRREGNDIRLSSEIEKIAEYEI